MMPKREPCPGCGSDATATCCVRCSATICILCYRQIYCPLCAFDVTQEVLAGKRVPARPGDAKLTYLLLDCPTSDIQIDAGKFERRRAQIPPPEAYSRGVGPIVVGHLMDRAGLTRITEPVVAAIPSAPLWIVKNDTLPSGEGWRWSTEAPPIGWFSEKMTPPDLCGWFIPGPHVLQILLRAQPTLPEAPQPIPTKGPFAVEPLPRSPVPTRFRNEDPPRRCPHCQRSASRFRDLGGTLICLACHRSFVM